MEEWEVADMADLLVSVLEDIEASGCTKVKV